MIETGRSTMPFADERTPRRHEPDGMERGPGWRLQIVMMLALALLLGCQQPAPAQPQASSTASASPTAAPVVAASPSPVASPVPLAATRPIMSYRKTFSGGQFQRGVILSDGSQAMEERAGRMMSPPDRNLAAKVNDFAQRFDAFTASGPGIGGCDDFEFLGSGPTVPSEQERVEIAGAAGC